MQKFVRNKNEWLLKFYTVNNLDSVKCNTVSKEHFHVNLFGVFRKNLIHLLLQFTKHYDRQNQRKHKRCRLLMTDINTNTKTNIYSKAHIIIFGFQHIWKHTQNDDV